jgi:hypothetical protein
MDIQKAQIFAEFLFRGIVGIGRSIFLPGYRKVLPETDDSRPEQRKKP